MRVSGQSTDYLRISPSRALWSVCAPLILVNLVLAVTTTLTNRLYSQYAGQTYFTVTGYLSVATTLFVNVVSSVYTAAWIKIAHQFALHDHPTVTRAMKNAGFTVLLASAACAGLMLLLTEPVLHALNVPPAFGADARLYYILYLIAYLPSALAALFITIVNGIGSSRRIFWINIIVICANLLAAVLLLAVFRMKLIGAALSSALGAALHLLVYWFLFRREGYFRAGERFRPDWMQTAAILRDSVPIALQNLFCTAGYLIVTLQANRLLPSDYITVLSVSLPLTGIMSAITSAGLAFVPPNFAAGNAARIRAFLRLSLVCCVLYGALCCLLYWTLGAWYFGMLFQNRQIIAYGVEYWRWYGLGHLALGVVYPLRTFFVSVGRGKLAMLSGTGEFIGNAFCAAVLIPRCGALGRSLSYPLGWLAAAVFLLAAYWSAGRRCAKIDTRAN